MDQLLGGLFVPGEEFFNGFVTWSALEDALKGLRTDSLTVPGAAAEQTTTKPSVDSPSSEPSGTSIVIERTAVETGKQTDPVSGNVSVKCNVITHYRQKTFNALISGQYTRVVKQSGDGQSFKLTRNRLANN